MKTIDRIIRVVCVFSAFTLPVWLVSSCSPDHGIMSVTDSSGLYGWKWPIGVGIGFVLLLSYVIWLGLKRKKK